MENYSVKRQKGFKVAFFVVRLPHLWRRCRFPVLPCLQMQVGNTSLYIHQWFKLTDSSTVVYRKKYPMSFRWSENFYLFTAINCGRHGTFVVYIQFSTERGRRKTTDPRKQHNFRFDVATGDEEKLKLP